MNSEEALSQLDFEQMVCDWYGRVFAYCRSQLRLRQDAEDATQETFVRGLGLMRRDRTIRTAGPWLRSVAHNVCVDTIRRKRIRDASSFEDETMAVRPGSSTEHQRIDDLDEQQSIVNAIHNLDDPLREVLMLHYYNSLTYEEIANWLGVARSTVNERLGKARRLLKDRLIDHQVFS